MCGGDGERRWIARDWNRRRSDQAFEYLRCRSCRTTYLGVIPSDLQRYYEGEYHTLPGSQQELATLAERERFKLDIVRKHARGTRLLEIGPSFGAFAFLVANAGFDVDVVEPDPGCREVLRRLSGVRVFDEIGAPELRRSSGYDVIALWQVLEHLSDAGSSLVQVRDMLRPNGIVIVATPNPESLQGRLFGRRWAHLDAPRHAALIPINALLKRARDLGLVTELVTMTDVGSLGWNSFGWATSLSNVTRSRPVVSLLSLIGRAIALAVRPLERTGGRGASYTVVLRKSP